jgi:hypothetical protein
MRDAGWRLTPLTATMKCSATAVDHCERLVLPAHAGNGHTADRASDRTAVHPRLRGERRGHPLLRSWRAVGAPEGGGRDRRPPAHRPFPSIERNPIVRSFLRGGSVTGHRFVVSFAHLRVEVTPSPLDMNRASLRNNSRKAVRTSGRDQRGTFGSNLPSAGDFRAVPGQKGPFFVVPSTGRLFSCYPRDLRDFHSQTTGRAFRRDVSGPVAGWGAPRSAPPPRSS